MCSSDLLRIFRQLQIFFRTFETKLRQRKTQRIVHLFERAPGGRILFRQFAPHSGVLRSLTGKDKCSFHPKFQGLSGTGRLTEAQLGKLGLDSVINIVFAELIGHANSVLDGIGV